MRDAPASSETWSRNIPGRVGAGVCSAIASHFGWSVVPVRVAFIVSLLISGGLACWVYLAFWAVTPFNEVDRSAAQRFLAMVTRFFTSTVSTASAPAEPPLSESPNVRPVE